MSKEGPKKNPEKAKAQPYPEDYMPEWDASSVPKKGEATVSNAEQALSKFRKVNPPESLKPDKFTKAWEDQELIPLEEGFEPDQKLNVNANRLNFRDPTTGYVLGKLSRGDQVAIFGRGRLRKIGGETFVKIYNPKTNPKNEPDGDLAYIALKYLDRGAAPQKEKPSKDLDISIDDMTVAESPSKELSNAEYTAILQRFLNDYHDKYPKSTFEQLKNAVHAFEEQLDLEVFKDNLAKNTPDFDYGIARIRASLLKKKPQSFKLRSTEVADGDVQGPRLKNTKQGWDLDEKEGA